jgi:hypothetical protein
MYLKKVRLGEGGIVIWCSEIQERLYDVVILRVMGNGVSALKENFCDFLTQKAIAHHTC